MLLDVLLSEGAVSLSVRQCIQKDLHRLLNTKEGSLRHLPDYGLPDLHKMYASFPTGVQNFIKMVQDKIIAFEPRLRHVQVMDVSSSKKKFCVLSLVINAEIIHHDKACFSSDFYSAGHVNLSQGMASI